MTITSLNIFLIYINFDKSTIRLHFILISFRFTKDERSIAMS